MPSTQEELSLDSVEFRELEARSARKDILESELESSNSSLEKMKESLKSAVVDGDFSNAYSAIEILRKKVQKLENDYKESWVNLGVDTEDPTEAHNRYLDKYHSSQK